MGVDRIVNAFLTQSVLDFVSHMDDWGVVLNDNYEKNRFARTGNAMLTKSVGNLQVD